MTHRDTNLRFALEHSPIRGEWVMLDSSYKAIVSKHEYPLEVQSLLGQMVTAAVILSSTIKFSGLLIIQARGSGAIKLLTAECNNQKEVRAFAQWDDEAIAGKGFSELLSNATLAISIIPDEGKRYQGIVALEKDSLAACLEDYFERSEQLKTRIWLAEGDNKAAGLLLQMLPFNSQTNKDEQSIADDWERISLLASTTTAEELLGLAPEVLLHRLFHEEEMQVFAPQTVAFHCPCSRQRIADSLASLPKSELEDMIREGVTISPQCEFCKTTYEFDTIELQKLLLDNINPEPPQAQ